MITQEIFTNEKKVWLREGILSIISDYSKSNKQQANLLVELCTRWVNNAVQDEITDYVKEHKEDFDKIKDLSILQKMINDSMSHNKSRTNLDNA